MCLLLIFVFSSLIPSSFPLLMFLWLQYCVLSVSALLCLLLFPVFLWYVFIDLGLLLSPSLLIPPPPLSGPAVLGSFCLCPALPAALLLSPIFAGSCWSQE